MIRKSAASVCVKNTSGASQMSRRPMHIRKSITTKASGAALAEPWSPREERRLTEIFSVHFAGMPETGKGNGPSKKTETPKS